MPVSASIEPACAPKTSGMRSCDGGRFSRTASTTTTGSSAATAPLTLMIAESTPPKSIISTISRKRLAPEPRASTCPVQAVRPVFSSAPETTKSEVTKIVAGSPKPASAWLSVRTPVAQSAMAQPTQTAMTGSRSQMKRPMTAGDDGEDDPDFRQASPRHRLGGLPAGRRVVAQFTCQRNRGPEMLGYKAKPGPKLLS